ncbi:MAG: neutral/alkaline non-lysosomal ceramidase N-terminal domain-containing protein, partial [Saprospiraceae bacterium]|nr:neutral/alkaline non-lysosomal ceramidase N-terminal domain-containing protein [Saprospiraceae bacterium]
MRRLILAVILCPCFISGYLTIKASTMEEVHGWKAGVSRVTITPAESMWMAGYASRTEPSDGTLHDLWAKALAIEDNRGHKAVLITLDLVGIPKEISDNIRDRIEDKFKLSRAQIIINTSHTHSGPVLQDALFDIYPLDSIQMIKIKQYSDWLEDQVIDLVEGALLSLLPVRL